MKPAVKVIELEKHFGSIKVLRGITFEVLPGKVLAIIGPSGSGKTTLLRCINLLSSFDRGEIEAAGFKLQHEKNHALIRKKVGMVFQQFNLWPHKTILENIILAPILVNGLSQIDAEKYAHEILGKVGLSDKARVYPHQLSGGEQQRVAIARALAMQPEVLLLDEITSALDPELVGEVLKVIRELAKEHRITLLIVTHEMKFAAEIADQVIFLDKGQLVESGDAQQVLKNPSQERTQEFLKRILEH